MKKIVLPLLLTIIAGIVSFYVMLPAINVHSIGFWIWVVALIAVFAATASIGIVDIKPVGKNSADISFKGNDKTRTLIVKIAFAAIAVIIVLAVAISIFSAPFFHAKTYASYGLELISDGSFDEDVEIVKNGIIPDIAIMDTATATTLGSRQIGSLGTLATQYELGEFMTTTINGKIVKVAPLGYGSFFKWMHSKANGIPGYVTVDPVVGTSSYVEPKNPMFYSNTGYFGDNVYRKMTFAYPTAIYENVHFELDNDGNPYWVATVYTYKIGLFGCKYPIGVITCDAVTGECMRYDADNIPVWVSIAWPADDLMTLVNYAGTYANGYWNSKLAKTGVYRCTDDYGYKVVGENLNAFTGITSAATDESNIAFVLCDEHTGKIIRYNIYGAEEYSAMASADGQVLNYGYHASFPSICNVEGTPVYVMALTDNANLIKKYAMVDLQDYTKVVVADTVQETWSGFVAKYFGKSNAGTSTEVDEYSVTLDGLEIDPVLASLNGSSVVYLYAKDGNIYRVALEGSEKLLLGDKNSKFVLTVTESVRDGVFAARLDKLS